MIRNASACAVFLSCLFGGFASGPIVEAQVFAFKCYGRINASRLATIAQGTPVSAPVILKQWSNFHFCENQHPGGNVVGFGAMSAQRPSPSLAVLHMPFNPEVIIGRMFVTATPITEPASIAAEIIQTAQRREVIFRMSRPVDFYYSLIFAP